MSGDANKSAVTLERLLQLKRAERPAPAFWEEFDRELRRRQLAAVVVKPSLLARVARGSLGLIRRAAPFGAAAAALGLGVFTARELTREETASVIPLASAQPPVEETAWVVLPEEQVALASTVPAPLEKGPIQTAGDAVNRYVVQEIFSVVNTGHAFVTNASPITLWAPADEVTGLMVNTLSLGSARSVASPEATGSF